MPHERHVHRWYNRSKWERRRRHQLRIEPLCALCLERGYVVPATVADHLQSHPGNYTAFRLASSAAYARPATIASSARIAHGLRSVPIAGLSPSIIRGIAREGDQGDGATPFAIAAGGGQSAKNRRQPTADRRGRPSLN